MSTHKALDRVCAIAIALCLLLTIFLLFGGTRSDAAPRAPIGYESRLFDATKIHTIDIVMDDWEGFLETAENEEYALCAVVIDGESSRNAAIRAKGNTSLRSVASMGSSRYSFKIEFDHYDSGKSYHGLDKLSLNNLIQDNTCMKDYLVYQMMDAFDVDSPLCSFAYLTVNGEDWGLYLAVEGVEDAFLRRNYGGAGDLYKPDSMDMGGGRGNGRDFDFDKIDRSTTDAQSAGNGSGKTSAPFPQSGDSGTPPDMTGGENALQDAQSQFHRGGMDGMTGGGVGADDVKLQYIDEEPSSYGNIFDSAKTDVTAADEQRLIASLKSLSAFEDLENVLDTDEVLRYFVAHNFVVNGDSYTGSMIHNYYLHEDGGKLSMIPWDYNLAFGAFAGGTASSAVNDPIDDMLSDRPMQAWIFSDEAYTEQYHTLYAQFLNTTDIQALIDEAYTLIAPYVEKDPTKFCTYEEFEAGVEALKSFCALRVESVRGQLDGAIPSTSEAQRTDRTALIDAGSLRLSALGTMNSGMSGAAPEWPDGAEAAQGADAADAFAPGGAPAQPPDETDAPAQPGFGANDMPQPPNDRNGGAMPAPPDAGAGDAGGAESAPAPDGAQPEDGAPDGADDTDASGRAQADSRDVPPGAEGSSGLTSNSGTDGEPAPQSPSRGARDGQAAPFSNAQIPVEQSGNTALLLGISVLILIGGLVFAFLFKSKR